MAVWPLRQPLASPGLTGSRGRSAPLTCLPQTLPMASLLPGAVAAPHGVQCPGVRVPGRARPLTAGGRAGGRVQTVDLSGRRPSLSISLAPVRVGDLRSCTGKPPQGLGLLPSAGRELAVLQSRGPCWPSLGCCSQAATSGDLPAPAPTPHPRETAGACLGLLVARQKVTATEPPPSPRPACTAWDRAHLFPPPHRACVAPPPSRFRGVFWRLLRSLLPPPTPESRATASRSSRLRRLFSCREQACSRATGTPRRLSGACQRLPRNRVVLVVT